MGSTMLILGIFLALLILTVSMEAAFKNKNEKNLKDGIKKGEEEISFPPPELENPKKD